MSRPRVLLPQRISETGLAILREHCEVVVPAGDDRAFSDSELADVQGALLRIFRADRTFMDRAPALRVIARHGVGIDLVDLAEATRRKIAVVNTPSANYNAVAEHAVHLMFGVSRQVVRADAIMRTGPFDDRLTLVGFELTGKTLGIVGLGRIGSRLADIGARGFDMEVLAFDPQRNASNYDGPARLCSTLDEMLPLVDVLTLHAPATPDTHNLLNADRIAKLKRGVVVINSARGSLVDEAALAAALESGHVAGAGLDVLADEPPTPNGPLLRAPNVLFSPHVASSTRESLDRMAEDAARALVDVLQGRRPESICNPEIYE